MGRIFEFGLDGLEQMLTAEGSILNAGAADGQVSIVEGNMATIVENPNAAQPEMSAEPNADLSTNPTLGML